MKLSKHLPGVALVACVSVLGACAHAEASASTGAPTTQGAGESVPSEFRSASFVSVSGTDAGHDLSWLATDPLTVSLTDQGGATLVVDTSCNTIGVPVTATGTTLDPDVNNVRVGTVGCLGAAGDQEAWATEFVSQRLSYALVGTTLTLTTPSETVVLQRSPSSKGPQGSQRPLRH